LRKRYRRNQQPRSPRRKDWVSDIPASTEFDEWDEFVSDDFERIMPRDESDRRRALEAAVTAADNGNLDQTSVIEANQNIDNAKLRQGVVIAYGSGLYRVSSADSEFLCTVRGSLEAQESGFTNPAAVGDRVVMRSGENGDGVIEQVLPRHSLLSRPDVFYSHLRQIVVANVDQLLIIAAWREPNIWFELIDRYLIAAQRSDLPAILCINKVDLATDLKECEQALEPYRELGVPCLLTSALANRGIDDLHNTLKGRSSVLAGLSGVGKSSLLTAVQPELDLRTGAVSTRNEGRHTTTQSTLITLDAETSVVDTPGIREFGLAGLTPQGLDQYFKDLATVASACRFRNCNHMDEPGCAVRVAVRTGKIADSRYHSYRQILESLA
jgi:ribosome biogenesis GTPase